MPKLTIVPEGDSFALYCEAGGVYGRYGTYEIALQAKEEWEEYFNEPLPQASL